MSAPGRRSLPSFAVVAPAVARGALRVLVLGVVGAVAVGCGDLSQDDLLFRAAIPSKDAVAVVPPGSSDDVDDGAGGTGQALTAECPAGDLRCDAAAIARNFNGLTFGLLDVVDRIASSPPTRRASDRRVWGPVFDADKDRTFRFEMVRDDDVTFAFCLHAADGRHDRDDAADDLGCDVDESGAFLRVLDGAFSPENLVEASARNGAGTMHLDVDALATLGGGDRFARDLIFAFDNRDDATSIHVDLQGARVNDVDRDAGYDFDRDATGAGSFALVIFKDVVDGALARSRAERVRLLARWQPDGGGRATGIVDEGNAQVPITVSQCWDAALSTTYTQAVDGTTSGVEAACAFANDDVVPPT
jgi:hypothetical protein